MRGSQLVLAPRQAVWEVLNDPDVLRDGIPGCQAVIRGTRGVRHRNDGERRSRQGQVRTTHAALGHRSTPQLPHLGRGSRRHGRLCERRGMCGACRCRRWHSAFLRSRRDGWWQACADWGAPCRRQGEENGRPVHRKPQEQTRAAGHRSEWRANACAARLWDGRARGATAVRWCRATAIVILAALLVDLR